MDTFVFRDPCPKLCANAQTAYVPTYNLVDFVKMFVKIKSTVKA